MGDQPTNPQGSSIPKCRHDVYQTHNPNPHCSLCTAIIVGDVIRPSREVKILVTQQTEELAEEVRLTEQARLTEEARLAKTEEELEGEEQNNEVSRNTEQDESTDQEFAETI